MKTKPSYVCVADSSGLISLFNPEDSNHKLALNLSHKLLDTNGTVYLPSDVFSETLNIFGKKFGHESAVKAAKKLINTGVYMIVDLDSETRNLSMELFEDQVSSTSFTDCVVMALAKHFQTQEIFGFDQIFIKNGFNIPL